MKITTTQLREIMDKKEENLHLLRHYIKETIDLGNTQFSPNRTDDVDKSEPNTPEEQKIYDALIGRVKHGKTISKDMAWTLRELINSKIYGREGSGFFDGPLDPSVPLYRGFAYPTSWFEKNIPIKTSEFVDVAGSYSRFLKHVTTSDPIRLDPPYIFGLTDNELYRGWTLNIKVAVGFALQHAKNATTPVHMAVLVLEPDWNPSNILLDFDPNVYNTTDGGDFFQEEEIINLGPVKCRDVWVASYTK